MESHRTGSVAEIEQNSRENRPDFFRGGEPLRWHPLQGATSSHLPARLKTSKSFEKIACFHVSSRDEPLRLWQPRPGGMQQVRRFRRRENLKTLEKKSPRGESQGPNLLCDRAIAQVRQSSLKGCGLAPACRRLNKANGTAGRACYFTILRLDSTSADTAKRKMPRAQPLNSSNKSPRLARPRLFRRSARAPQGHKALAAARAENVSISRAKTATNAFASFCSLAQKRLPDAERLRKIIPRLAKNRQILRENSPLVWAKDLKNVKNRFCARLHIIQEELRLARSSRCAARRADPGAPGLAIPRHLDARQVSGKSVSCVTRCRVDGYNPE